MGEQKSFKTRVKETAINIAPQYFSYYVSREYLLISDSFVNAPYYVVKAEKDNYLHLIGVTTSLTPRAFFDKCFQGTLEEDDFELVAHGQDAKRSKGSIRRKINSLPLIINMFTSECLVEENFRKNTVLCSFASTDGECTLGFIATPSARPKTLLIGDELDHEKAKNLKLVLSKLRSDDKYSTVVVGTDEDLRAYYNKIKDQISLDLDKRIKLLMSNNENRNLEE